MRSKLVFLLGLWCAASYWNRCNGIQEVPDLDGDEDDDSDFLLPSQNTRYFDISLGVTKDVFGSWCSDHYANDPVNAIAGDLMCEAICNSKYGAWCFTPTSPDQKKNCKCNGYEGAFPDEANCVEPRDPKVNTGEYGTVKQRKDCKTECSSYPPEIFGKLDPHFCSFNETFVCVCYDERDETNKAC